MCIIISYLSLNLKGSQVNGMLIVETIAWSNIYDIVRKLGLLMRHNGVRYYIVSYPIYEKRSLLEAVFLCSHIAIVTQIST